MGLVPHGSGACAKVGDRVETSLAGTTCWRSPGPGVDVTGTLDKQVGWHRLKFEVTGDRTDSGTSMTLLMMLVGSALEAYVQMRSIFVAK